MVVAINAPQQDRVQQEREKPSDMDKLFMALRIAETGLGAAVNYDTFVNSDEVREQNAAFKQQQLDIARAGMEAGVIHQDDTRQLKRQELASATTERNLTRETAATAAVQTRRDALSKEFRSRPEFKEAQVSLSGARGVEKLLSKQNPRDPNPSNVRMVLSLKQMLRSTGETRFSDADVRQAIPDASLAGEVIRLLSLKGNNEGTDADVAALQEVARLMKEQAVSNLNRHADSMASGQLAQGTELNPEQIKEQLFTMDTLTSDRTQTVHGELVGTGTGKDKVGDEPPPLDFSGFGADADKVKAAVGNVPAKDQARFLKVLRDKQKAAAGGGL